MKILEKSLIGNLSLNNRMVMAPMTRSRANEKGIITELAATYYAQRASAGLIISEAINISEQGLGMPNTPGLFTDEQITAWKKVTYGVHLAGGKIFAQLNHSGRVGHSLNKKGNIPVAPSAIAIEKQETYTHEGMKNYEIPAELTISEVKQIIEDYSMAASNGIKAGFDGIEFHAALGYLPNQFLSQSSNHRTDEYGGTLEKRSRFILETLQELINVAGEEKVGIKLSPSVPINGISENNPIELYSYLITELDKLPIAYIHLMQPLFPLDDFPQYPENVLEEFGKLTSKNIIVNGGIPERKEKWNCRKTPHNLYPLAVYSLLIQIYQEGLSSMQN